MKNVLLTAAMFAVAASNVGAQEVIYDRVPTTLAPSYVSIGAQAYAYKEFGDHVVFAPGGRNLQSATVTVVNWAMFSDYANNPNWNSNSSSFSVPITMNLYSVGAGNTVGSVIASRTIDAVIAWRPAADVTCPGGTAWRAPNGNCYNGFAQNIAFDFTGTVVPDDIIFGITYNTQTYGYAPTGVVGPYNSLNVGITTDGPLTGSDGAPAGVTYLNTTAGNGGDGSFSQNSVYGVYSPMVEFVATSTVVPEPSTYALMAAGLAGLFAVQRRRRRSV